MASGIVGEYLALKGESDADLLAMQMGDFYEFFGEDAVTVGQELDLKVSERSAGGEPSEMAGVPVDDLEPYLTALVERGYRVAVADQRDADGDTTRALSRVVTPGRLLETDDDGAQYLAAFTSVDGSYGLAFCDITTGTFRTTSVSGPDASARALTELYRFAPVEVLPGPDVRTDDGVLERLRERVDGRLTLHTTEAFAPGRARHALGEQFGEAVESVGLEVDVAVAAAGAVVDYVAETGVGALASVTRLGTYSPDDHLALDATTQRNLELTETMTGGGRSLLETVDHTETSAGGRLLREWLTRPLQRASRSSGRSRRARPTAPTASTSPTSRASPTRWSTARGRSSTGCARRRPWTSGAVPGGRSRRSSTSGPGSFAGPQAPMAASGRPWIRRPNRSSRSSAGPT
jgi:DNA mismatch repair protein MutS